MNVLISYAHVRNPKAVEGLKAVCEIAETWCLDSGAYTVHNTGGTIEVEDYISFCRSLEEWPKPPCKIFALDVIGDEQASIDNAIAMRDAGINVVPTWHAGSSIDALETLRDEFEEVAFGGLVARLRNNRAQLFSEAKKRHWLSRGFNVVWPHRVHGFGITSAKLLREFPFSSVDSTTWRLRPSLYGSWKSYGARMPLRINKANEHCLITEVAWWIEEERAVGERWKATHEKHGLGPFCLFMSMQPSDAAILAQAATVLEGATG